MKEQRDTQSKLFFPIDYSAELIQKELLTEYELELKEFSNGIHKLTRDTELIDKLLLLPEKILRSSVERTLVYGLNNHREYFVTYEDTTR